jgi:hypothetical protein
MTLRVNDKGVIFWSMAMEAPKIVEFKDFRAFLVGQIRRPSRD